MHSDTFQPLRPRRNRTGFKRSIDLAALKRQSAAQAGRDAGCRKVAYPDKHAAHEAMGRIRGKAAVARHPEKKLRAAYECPFCAGWHLTSQEQRR